VTPFLRSGGEREAARGGTMTAQLWSSLLRGVPGRLVGEE
jgi:hypothetical protein